MLYWKYAESNGWCNKSNKHCTENMSKVMDAISRVIAICCKWKRWLNEDSSEKETCTSGHCIFLIKMQKGSWSKNSKYVKDNMFTVIHAFHASHRHAFHSSHEHASISLHEHHVC